MVPALAGRVFSSSRKLLTRNGGLLLYRKAFAILGLSSALFLAVLQWIFFLPTPHPGLNFLPSFPCRDDEKGYVLEEMGVCTDACGKMCFPRVHGICFGHSQVTVCEGQPPIPQGIKITGGDIPTEMSFYMEKPRKKVPVKRGTCPGWNSSTAKPSESGGAVRWIRGPQMVADLSAMPTGWKGPNPHHDSEKVVPAILISHQYGLNSSFFWFANPNDPFMISKWSLGLVETFSKDMKTEYLNPVAKNEAPICFEDAILFTRLTMAGYIPNQASHDWLRRRVLEHCQVPKRDAEMPVKEAVIIERFKDARNFANYAELKEIIERKLEVGIKKREAGPWEACEQVRLVADADFLVTPHGAHNLNLLAARPGAIVMEVYPYLYYSWYGHYIHAGRLLHEELLGTWPSEKSGMPLRMRLYALIYGWQKCAVVRHCMNYGKTQQIHVDLAQLESVLDSLIRDCRIVVQNSTCPPRPH